MSTNGDAPSMVRVRRKRVQLSCGPCRWKKVSCDRALPCQRCRRAGKPERCSFDTGTVEPHTLTNPLVHENAVTEPDEIALLRVEVAQLKERLLKDHSPTRHRANTYQDDLGLAHTEEPAIGVDGRTQTSATGFQVQLSHPKQRKPQGYYSQHTIFRFFEEIPQLFPLIQEVFNDSLAPRGILLKKKQMNKQAVSSGPITCKSLKHILLPPQEVTNILINFYSTYIEHIHRIVHVPTFNREYIKFWTSAHQRQQGMVALVLAMISLSLGVFSDASDTAIDLSPYRDMCSEWLAACDEWVKQQGMKHDKSLQYQVSCLVHLARRVHMIKKKNYWIESGRILQHALMDGLHHETPSTIDTPYTRESKRRMWATVRELDLQSAFEFELPTLLHGIDSNVTCPANLDDEEYDEEVETMPLSQGPARYTRTSYQFYSSKSWKLRLEISKRLHQTGSYRKLPYDEVLPYTHRITQEIQSLPSWDIDLKDNESELMLSTYSILFFQLTECLLAISRPYLQNDDNEFWLSQNICSQMSRHVLVLHDKLVNTSSRGLLYLRSVDLYLASLSLLRISMGQITGSLGMLSTNSTSILDLLEHCLPYTEDRFLLSDSQEPWCAIMMYAAILLFKMHDGTETWDTAKVACTTRFLALYQKRKPRSLGQAHGTSMNHNEGSQHILQALDHSHRSLGTIVQLPTPYQPGGLHYDLGDRMSFMTDLDDTWETWDWTWPNMFD